MLNSSFQSKKAACLLVFAAIIQMPAAAQNTLEFVQDGVNNSYELPVPKGPTSIPQTLVFYQNRNGAADEGIYFEKQASPVTVTFSFDDQPYVNVPQHVTGMTFGAAGFAVAPGIPSAASPAAAAPKNRLEIALSVIARPPAGGEASGRGFRLQSAP